MKERIFPGWWQVAVAAIIQMVGISIFTAFSVVAIPLQQAFQPSHMVLMLSIPVTILVSGVLNPFVGEAMSRHSIKLLMLGGAACMVGGFVALSFTTSIVQVIIVYAVLMAPASIMLGPLAAATLLSRWFSRHRGRALGIAGMGAAFSGLVFAPLTQFLVDAFEWRMALRLMAGIAFLLTVPVIALLTIDRPSDRNLYPDGAAEPPSGKMDLAPLVSTGTVLRDGNFWLAALMTGLVFAISTALLSNMMQMAGHKGIIAQHAAWLLAAFACANFSGKTLFAGIGDRVNLRMTLAAALIVVTIGLAVCLTAHSFLTLLFGVVLFGFPIGCIVPLWALLLSKFYGPESVGKTMGLAALFTMPLSLVAAPFFGAVFDWTGNYDNAFLICIALMVVAVLGMVKLRVGPSRAAAQPAPAA